MVRPILAALALFGLVFLAPGLLPLDGRPRTAHASVSLEMDLDALLKRSHLVVVATPTEAHGTWETGDAASGRRIVTYSRLSIERVIDGKVESSETWVRSLGGTVGNIGQKVFGEAELALGRPALFFLHARSDGTHAVVGLAQGEFPIETATDGSRRVMASAALGALVPPGAVSVVGARRELAGLSIDDAADRVLVHRGRVGVSQ